MMNFSTKKPSGISLNLTILHACIVSVKGVNRREASVSDLFTSHFCYHFNKHHIIISQILPVWAVFRSAINNYEVIFDGTAKNGCFPPLF